jgi:hypothetical protein
MRRSLRHTQRTSGKKEELDTSFPTVAQFVHCGNSCVYPLGRPRRNLSLSLPIPPLEGAEIGCKANPSLGKMQRMWT